MLIRLELGTASKRRDASASPSDRPGHTGQMSPQCSWKYADYCVLCMMAGCRSLRSIHLSHGAAVTARTGAEPSASPPWSVFCRFLTESLVVQGRGAGSDPSHGRPGVRMSSTARSCFVMNHDGVLQQRPVTPPGPTRPARRIASSAHPFASKSPSVEDSEFASVVDWQEPHQSQRNMPSRHWGSRFPARLGWRRPISGSLFSRRYDGEDRTGLRSHRCPSSDVQVVAARPDT